MINEMYRYAIDKLKEFNFELDDDSDEYPLFVYTRFANSNDDLKFKMEPKGISIRTDLDNEIESELIFKMIHIIIQHHMYYSKDEIKIQTEEDVVNATDLILLATLQVLTIDINVDVNNDVLSRYGSSETLHSFKHYTDIIKFWNKFYDDVLNKYIDTDEFPFLLKIVVDLDFRYFPDKLINDDIKIIKVLV